jgi:prophage antirepressor-like protein
MTRLAQKVTDGKKLCSKCGLLLPLGAFNKQSDALSGHYSQCRICKNSKSNVAKKPETRQEVKAEYKCENNTELAKEELSMSELSIFKFEEKQVRTVIVNNEPYFVANDVAEILGYTNPRKTISDHCKGVTKSYILTDGGSQEMSVIPERDVYRLIMRSKLPAAEKFENWVVSEVLPSVRKHGGYLAPQVDFTNPDVMINLLNNWKADREKLIEANKAIELQKPKVEFYDAVTGSNDTIDMGQAAKILNMGIGRNSLFELLREKKILMYNNIPFQTYVDRGWFRLIESKFNKPDGTNCIYTKTVVFQKGLENIRKIIIDNIGLKADCEFDLDCEIIN